jgi:hypothetical protein
MMRIGLPLLLLLLAETAAASEQTSAPPARAQGFAIGRWLQPSAAPVSPRARIFLVSGARDIANFAQEVVDQRKLWLARGYAPEQIECFFAAPAPDHRDDVDQFLALEEELKGCHLASPADVFDALAAVAANYSADHFYLYISSHGSRPALELPPVMVRRIDPQSTWLPAALTEARADSSSRAHEWLAPFQISMEGARFDAQNWGWASYFSRLRQSRNNPAMTARENLFTPALLATALQAFPAGVRKVVVIQACFSGGFLLPSEEAPSKAETLRAVADITVLTAARADRTSFGCDSSGDTTYYGRSFHKVLEANAGLTVPELQWQQVHEQVNQEVEQLEQQNGIGDRMRSLPQFYSDTAREDVSRRYRGGARKSF